MSRRVFIADDDPAIVESLVMLLQDEGYEVAGAESSQGLQRLLARQPDLILLDIWMSGEDGGTICRGLKEQRDTCDVPVILFSANRDGAEIAREAGADDFIAKPFDIRDLLGKIDYHMSS